MTWLPAAGRWQAVRGRPFRGRLAGAVAGAVFAGLVISVWLLIGEVGSGQPSELTRTIRIILDWFRLVPSAVGQAPGASVEYAAQVFHLLLSVAAGVAYALVWPHRGSVLQTGLLFGAGFFLFAHVVVGRLAGFMPPIWQVARQEPFLTIALSLSQHLSFGLCTVLFAHFAQY